MAKPLPDPTLAYAEFIVELIAYGEITTIADFASKAGGQRRLWTVNVATHMANALQDEIVVVARTTRDGNDVAGYQVTQEADAFWHNAGEAGAEPDVALAGWRALVSLTSRMPDP